VEGAVKLELHRHELGVRPNRSGLAFNSGSFESKRYGIKNLRHWALYYLMVEPPESPLYIEEMRARLCQLLFSILLLLGPGISENTLACQVIERSYGSAAIGTTETYLLIKPDAQVPIAGIVYFLHGLGGNRYSIRDLGACAQVDRLAQTHHESLLVVAPDGGTSYWMNGAHTNQNYGDLIANELVAQVEVEFAKSLRTPGHRILAGISMGGAGAIQISMNYPRIFGAVGAHSPVFRTQEEATAQFPNQFGTGFDYQSRDPFSLILIQHKTFIGPIYIDMGGQDPWFLNTKSFQSLLQSMQVPGTFKVGVDTIGGHATGYWSFHLPEYFDWYFQQVSGLPFRGRSAFWH
jgi:enterochelin esterase-like enzyme